MAGPSPFWHGPPAMRLTPKLSLVAALLAGAAISCGGTPKPEANVPEAPPPPPPPKAEPAPVGPALLPAHVLTKLDDENAAPYFARRGEEGLLLYASKGRWLARAAGADGAPKSSETREVATMGSDPTMASLKAVGDGYLAVWTERVAKNNAIKVMALDAEGKAKGEPALVTQVTDEVTWIDVLPNKKGALLVWEVPHDDRSDVFVAPVSDVGKSLGAASAAAQAATHVFRFAA